MDWTYSFIIIAYILGSVPFTFVIGKLWGRLDLSTKGSGNLGGTNAVRVLGWGPGVIAGLADIGKGAAAIWLAQVFNAAPVVIALTALAVTAGHNWSIFFWGKKGGKGVSTTFGVFIYLCPVIALISLGIGLEIVLLSRLVSLASLIFCTLVPLGLILTGSNPFYIIAALILCISAFWRHRKNIQRLWEGKERRLGEKE